MAYVKMSARSQQVSYWAENRAENADCLTTVVMPAQKYWAPNNECCKKYFWDPNTGYVGLLTKNVVKSIVRV